MSPAKNPNNPLGYQRRRSPKKATRPVVGPGRERHDHFRTGEWWRDRRLLAVLGAGVVVLVLVLGLVFGLGGSTAPPSVTTTTVAHSPLSTTTVPATTGTTTTPAATGTTTPAATGTTTPAATGTTVPATTTTHP